MSVSAVSLKRKPLTQLRQKKRVRVAAITLVILCGSLLLLAIQSCVEQATHTTSATDYLRTIGKVEQVDPLSLSGPNGIFELTGVSSDGRVIGYVSNEPLAQTCLLMKDALQTDGWLLDNDNSAGLLSFCKAGSAAMPGSSLFVQCIAVGEGSSLVVQLW